jgi:hypothetical protein
MQSTAFSFAGVGDDTIPALEEAHCRGAPPLPRYQRMVLGQVLLLDCPPIRQRPADVKALNRPLTSWAHGSDRGDDMIVCNRESVKGAVQERVMGGLGEV